MSLLNMVGNLVVGVAGDSKNRKQVEALHKGIANLSAGLANAQGVAQSFMAGPATLTTGFEAQLIDYNKSAHALGASFGILGKDLEKFSSKSSSMAIGMNMGIEETGKALKAYTRSSKQMNDMGIENAETLAKLANVTGTSAEEFEFTATQMGALGLKGKGAKEVMDQLVTSGQAMGNVSETLASMPTMMDQLRQHAKMMGKELDSEHLAAYAKQTSLLATGFQKATGGSARDAMAMSAQLNQSLLDAQDSLQGMFAGTEGALPEFSKQFGIAAGNIKPIMDSMKKGPAEFVSGLTEMVSAAKKAGKFGVDQQNFLRQRMKAGGISTTDADKLMMVLSSDEASKQMKTVSETKASLADVAKAYRTGYTEAQVFELANAQLEKSFRDLTKPKVNTFLTDYKKATKDFAKTLQETSKKGGAMGAFVDKLSEIDSLGAMALAPEKYRPALSLAGDVFKKIAPLKDIIMGVAGAFLGLATALPGLTMGFGLLKTAVLSLGPGFLVVTAAVAGAAYVYKTLSDQQEKAARKSEMLNAVLDTANAFVKKHTQHLHALEKQLSKQVKGSDAWKATLKKVKAEHQALGDAAKAAAKVSVQASLASEDAALSMEDRLYKNVDEIMTKMSKNLSEIWDGIKNYASSTWTDIKTSFSQLWIDAKQPFVDFKKFVSDTMSNIVDDITEDITKATSPFDALKRIGTDAFQAIEDIVDKVHGNSVNTTVAKDLDKAGKAFDKFANKGVTAFTDIDDASGAGSAPGGGPSKPTFGSNSAALIMAVNNPSWYSQDYRPLFLQLLSQMQGAQPSTSTAAPATRGAPGRRSSAPPDTGLNGYTATAGNGRPLTSGG